MCIIIPKTNSRPSPSAKPPSSNHSHTQKKSSVRIGFCSVFVPLHSHTIRYIQAFQQPPNHHPQPLSSPSSLQCPSQLLKQHMPSSNKRPSIIQNSKCTKQNPDKKYNIQVIQTVAVISLVLESTEDDGKDANADAKMSTPRRGRGSLDIHSLPFQPIQPCLFQSIFTPPTDGQSSSRPKVFRVSVHPVRRSSK
ncbi:hypothetical protein K402DRAFT_91362 [Aulographum hederae CBS 113979]|uniref:Uncharacterized protein n=1 Tax=Aulographum hederae CBS 113979 TaxID=1176131 RepID=A0A6G1GZH1_9PEZI|nr:hypothetical protein K402DRAFT_91362 [Aulographum hederae CBS 113979]